MVKQNYGYQNWKQQGPPVAYKKIICFITLQYFLHESGPVERAASALPILASPIADL